MTSQLIARRTGYHVRFSRVIYHGKPLPCVKPGGRGLFGDAVLTKAAIESTDSQPFEAQAGPERRQWLCVSTRVGVDVCTAHLASPETDEVAANDPQCAELRALLARRAAARTVIFGGDVNRRPSCAPHGFWTRTDSSAHQDPGSQHVYGTGALRSPSARVGRPHTPTTTSCWSARTSPHNDDCTLWHRVPIGFAAGATHAAAMNSSVIADPSARRGTPRRHREGLTDQPSAGSGLARVRWGRFGPRRGVSGMAREARPQVVAAGSLSARACGLARSAVRGRGRGR